jgi:hypothetical protein
MQYPTVIALTVLTAAGAKAEAEAKRAREHTANFIVIALFLDVVRTTRWDKNGGWLWYQLLREIAQSRCFCMMGLAYAGRSKSLVEDEDTSPGPQGRLKEIPWMVLYAENQVH